MTVRRETPGTCTHTSAALASGIPAKPDTFFPYGLVTFEAGNCLGGTVDVTLTYPLDIDLSTVTVWKYNTATSQWIDMTSVVTIADNKITYSVADDGPYDSETGVVGVIRDPVGIGIGLFATPNVSVPIFDLRMLVLLILLSCAVGLVVMRRRT